MEVPGASAPAPAIIAPRAPPIPDQASRPLSNQGSQPVPQVQHQGHGLEPNPDLARRIFQALGFSSAKVEALMATAYDPLWEDWATNGLPP